MDGGMSQKDQIQQFADEVDKIVERARCEYDLSYAAVVGVFQMKIHTLCNEAGQNEDQC